MTSFRISVAEKCSSLEMILETLSFTCLTNVYFCINTSIDSLEVNFFFISILIPPFFYAQINV